MRRSDLFLIDELIIIFMTSKNSYSLQKRKYAQISTKVSPLRCRNGKPSFDWSSIKVRAFPRPGENFM